MAKRPEVLQATFAISGLVIGLFIYLLDRRADTVYFIPDWLSLTSNITPFFGYIGNYLPTFIHVYVFILLTAAVMAPPATRISLICVSWLTIDSLFEIAQMPVIAQWIAEHVPVWFQGVPFLTNTAAYFMAGTFDVLDLFSIAAGTLCAYSTVVISYRRGQKNDAQL
jgi:hypothetical protein